MIQTSRPTSQLTRRTRIALFAAYCVGLALLFLAGAEVILRAKGWQPWKKPDLDVRVVPGDRFYAKHPTLGYAHIPGRFTVILGGDYSFTVTHLPNSLRITHPLDTYETPSDKEEIWIFGCSITHGWSVNDEQTYPWLLQERFPEYEIVNFGVSGYGTIHSLLQFRDALKRTRPKLAILAYADFHDERNTFTRVRQKGIAPYNKFGPLVQPYARMNGDHTLRYAMAEVEYREFPFMRSTALAHFIESKYDQYEEQSCQSHAVSEALVAEMARIAHEHGVAFVVVGIAALKVPVMRSMLDFAREHGIPSVDISVNLWNRANTNAPYDGHPNAVAHAKYADRLAAFLNAEVIGSDDSKGTTRTMDSLSQTAQPAP